MFNFLRVERFGQRRRRLDFAIAVAGSLLALLGMLTVAPAASGAPASARTPVGAGKNVPLPPPPRSADEVSPQSGWQGPYTFRNVNSGKCLDVWGPVTGDGAGFVQYTCFAGRVSQMFYLWADVVDGGVAAYHIGNGFSGKCVDLHDFGRNAILVQEPCVTLDNQSWIVTTSHANTYQNSYTAMCMDINGASKGDNAWAVQWDCTGGTSQVFLLYNA